MNCTRQSLMGSSGKIWRLDCERDHPLGAQPVRTRELVLSSFPKPLFLCLDTRALLWTPWPALLSPSKWPLPQVPENSWGAGAGSTQNPTASSVSSPASCGT